MSKIYRRIDELVGNTPMLELARFAAARDVKARLIAKLESYNPAGSVKDRIAMAMLNDAEAEGKVTARTVIVEPTSGNTGIGLAAIASARGYRLILIMPDTMSVERRSLLKALGAELILTEGAKGMRGAIEKAKEVAQSLADAFIPGQFENPANPRIHYQTTGPEIWRDCSGQVDALVSGVGTGGTITGVGRYLREKNPQIKIYAVEPEDSAVLSGGKAGPHKIQGLGAGFVPAVLDTSIYNDVLRVGNEDAIIAGRELARKEGLLAGISSGAAAHAAAVLGVRPDFAGKTIAVVLPDTGERYLSTVLFNDPEAAPVSPK